MDITTIAGKYSEYVCMDFERKLHAGELLAEIATCLLNTKNDQQDINQSRQRTYLMLKIAVDLTKQVEMMAMTKQYDSVPALEKYTYQAFELVYDYCGRQPARLLLDYLPNVIYYEKFKENSVDLNTLIELFNKSMELEKNYLGYINSRVIEE